MKTLRPLEMRVTVRQSKWCNIVSTVSSNLKNRSTQFTVQSKFIPLITSCSFIICFSELVLFYAHHSRMWWLIRLNILQAKTLLLYPIFVHVLLHLCAMWTLRVAQMSVKRLIKRRLKYDVNFFQTY